jgi:ABC-type lipoprotein export system ATPase subunit
MQNRVRTIDVFTPTTPAKFTFVERKLLASQLMNALRTPGKQVVVYGQTGSGKTTLLTNKLAEIYGTKVVTSRCTVATTFENLLFRFRRTECVLRFRSVGKVEFFHNSEA